MDVMVAVDVVVGRGHLGPPLGGLIVDRELLKDRVDGAQEGTATWVAM